MQPEVALFILNVIFKKSLPKAIIKFDCVLLHLILRAGKAICCQK